MIRRISLAFVSAIGVTPALAHPGSHSRMSFLETVQHYTGPDHLALLALIGGVGVFAYRLGRRIEARVRVKAKRPKGGRS